MAAKRARDDSSAGTAASEVAAQRAEQSGQRDKKARSKRRKAAVDEAALPAEERARRQRQRELRELALKMRARGKTYNPHKAKAKVFRAENAGVVTPRPSQRPAPPPIKRTVDFEVAIVPIFWNQKPAEKKMVVARCEEAARLLADAGITSHVDAGSGYTPGQKMRHWEEKGVKVRLEVGPKDAEQSQCIIARSQPVAGQVAHKVPGEIGPKLPQAVRELLQMRDRDVPKGDYSKYEKKGAGDAAARQLDSEPGAEAQDPGSDADGHQDSEMDVGSDDEDAVGEADRRRAIAITGDALEDDFMEEVMPEDVPEALSEADKKRLRKKKKSSLLRNAGGHTVDVADTAVEAANLKKKKKAKVIRF